MYSDMSRRIRARSSLKSTAARARPARSSRPRWARGSMKEPIGLVGALRPTRERRMARTMEVTAWFWPTIACAARLEAQEPLGLLLLELEHSGSRSSWRRCRRCRPREGGHDLVLLLLPLGLEPVELLLELALRVAKTGRLLVVLQADRRHLVAVTVSIRSSRSRSSGGRVISSGGRASRPRR